MNDDDKLIVLLIICATLFGLASIWAGVKQEDREYVPSAIRDFPPKGDCNEEVITRPDPAVDELHRG